jgi:hypothetical protein
VKLPHIHHLEDHINSLLTIIMSEVAAAPSALNARDVTRDIFSASIGSVACCYTGQPFDTVKVRMQTNPSLFPSVAFTTKSILRNEVSLCNRLFINRKI